MLQNPQHFRFVNGLLLVLLLMTQYALWFGDNNYFHWQHLRKQSQEQADVNQQLSQRNHHLLTEVINIKAGGEAIETIARSHHGLIKKGETFFQIIEK